MQLIAIIILIWYFTSGRNNPKYYYNTKKKPISIIIGIIVLISLMSSDLFFFALVLGIIFLPLFLIYKVIMAIIGTVRDIGTSNKEGVPSHKSAQREYADMMRANSSAQRIKTSLPAAVSKRIKLLKKFNNKYNLTLTEAQINTIVNASYVTPGWTVFLESMMQDYSSVHEWFRSNMDDWLRVYIYVFNVQTISSDMNQQRSICFDSFYQIFNYADLSTYNTPAWDIEKINNEFLTNFDDVTFMMAYRFLERNGRKFELGRAKVMNTNDSLNDLMSKYDKSTDANIPRTSSGK